MLFDIDCCEDCKNKKFVDIVLHLNTIHQINPPINIIQDSLFSNSFDDMTCYLKNEYNLSLTYSLYINLFTLVTIITTSLSSRMVINNNLASAYDESDDECEEPHINYSYLDNIILYDESNSIIIRNVLFV